ncbi:hypothetical protein W97_02310 [Coniosporium apollinis CBS 100218]|uniref:Methyltransferase type 11 domain-containing protein n=1 Tax=Coniosporium apollinis (strain CBS 100218) TaxID=1168221 RepID=R7YMK3_CONA1|nr:uncharacterized protein W97_02310 [Coniosporium apollinis CBS 100218]EON63083.1 hypothetical protein W97_02310 [Coniosporium apollinis CBS 100218]
MSKENIEKLQYPGHWDKRCSGDGAEADKYDWPRSFSTIRPFLDKHLPPARSNPRILQLGCGNSALPKDLHNHGYTNQVSIDFSSTVVSTMRTKHPDMDWQVMDVKELRFSANHFDAAVDNAALDAMLHESLPDLPAEVKRSLHAHIDEIGRVLKPGGKWLYITWRQPHSIRPLLQRPDFWTLNAEVLAEDSGVPKYYGYVMTKLEEAHDAEVVGVEKQEVVP